MITNIIDQLKRDEGFVDHIYIDSVGKRTIGYGHNLDAKPIPDLDIGPLTEWEATAILKQDVYDTNALLIKDLPWLSNFDFLGPRYGVLLNMSFNMGVNGLLKFKRFLGYVESGDYNIASFEMLNSLWARQTHQRAFRLSIQMRDGVWQ